VPVPREEEWSQVVDREPVPRWWLLPGRNGGTRCRGLSGDDTSSPKAAPEGDRMRQQPAYLLIRACEDVADGTTQVRPLRKVTAGIDERQSRSEQPPSYPLFRCPMGAVTGEPTTYIIGHSVRSLPYSVPISYGSSSRLALPLRN
jgi:hypothetical protein